MCLATVDVKKFIYHMACNSNDTQIAIVENQGMFENIEESIVRIYDVGRSRNEDEAVSYFCDYFDKSELIIFVILGRR